MRALLICSGSSTDTRSHVYPVKRVHLLGPLPESLKRRAEEAKKTKSGLLFPFPGTDRAFSEEEYRRWRSHYYVPIARARGLDAKTDDPYSLRHVYGSLRAAAGHSVAYIEQSMGTSLVSKVYTTVFAKYEAKPLDIDKTIRAARAAALRELGARLDALAERVAA